MSERAFVSVTAARDLEWVLRGCYQASLAEVRAVFRALAGIEHVVLEDRGAVLLAVDWTEQGLDFADALHLARCARASDFAIFDRTLAKRAERLGITPPVTLLA